MCCVPVQIVRRTIQADYEAGYLLLSITGSATPRGVNSSRLALQPVMVANQTVDQRRLMEVTIQTLGGVSSVTSAGAVKRI